MDIQRLREAIAFMDQGYGKYQVLQAAQKTLDLLKIKQKNEQLWATYERKLQRFRDKVESHPECRNHGLPCQTCLGTAPEYPHGVARGWPWQKPSNEVVLGWLARNKHLNYPSACSYAEKALDQDWRIHCLEIPDLMPYVQNSLLAFAWGDTKAHKWPWITGSCMFLWADDGEPGFPFGETVDHEYQDVEEWFLDLTRENPQKGLLTLMMMLKKV